MRETSDKSISFRRQALVSIVLWTLLLALSYSYLIAGHRQSILNLAKMQTNTAYNKDMAYLKWFIETGGVYARISDKIKPSQFLKTQKSFFVVPGQGNYSFITATHLNRLVHEYEAQQYGIISRLTSLLPLNPKNKPVDWEYRALMALNSGSYEESGLREINGHEYFTLIRSLKAESVCIGCHAKFNYTEGDVMGGLSISLPMVPFSAAMLPGKLRIITTCLLVWAMGLGLILLRNRLMINRARVIIRSAEIEKEANEAKSLFLSMVSHELRTPLNAIIGMTDLALEEAHGIEQKEYLQMSLSASQGLALTLNDLLDFSRIESGKMSVERVEFDVLDVLHEVKGLFFTQIDLLGLGFQVIIPDRFNGTVTGDPARLRQILVNLVGNALKFTTKGAVTISVMELRCSGEPESSRHMVFSVADTGIGIEESMVDNIFMNFTQANEDTFRKYGGSGLGLHICSSLVDLMGGEIWVESVEGKGSTFSFTIRDGGCRR